ncbi:glycosyltransferase [Jiangella aurantiaca]|uniref:Glycosyltransferase n=1 Tax=Jiangella aurantiaca TaxID=2530373 RepID=A0A4R5AK35_9ACTN|nr:glycosyltransferase [Jiangella aurantiaca]TDD72981.1 glycosyltransferase [Jiangella aurantiaca]
MALRTAARRWLPGALVDALARAARRATWLRRPLPPQEPFPQVRAAAARLLVGPTNSAGQGWAWARAAERVAGDDVAAACFAVRRNSYGFADDYGVPVPVYAHPQWQRAHERYVVSTFTHVVIESMRPLFGSRHARDARGDVAVLTEAGLRVALAFHGSDVRLPSRHAEREPWSPFRIRDDLTERLEEQARRLAAFATAFERDGGPVLVSTPDLFDDLPGAIWLPVVVDPDRWQAPPSPRRRRPVVVHAPSNSRLKGTEIVEAAMAELSAKRVVEYRRLEGVPNDRMPAALADADIVVDQLTMGLYGVAACEAMAAGRTVVSYVGDAVRERVRERTGHDVPIVEATPDDLADVVAALAADPDVAGERAARGPGFVRAVHDGRVSGSVLADWLRRTTR